MITPQKPATNRVIYNDDPYQGLKDSVRNNTQMLAMQYLQVIIEEHRQEIAELRRRLDAEKPEPRTAKRTTAKDEDAN